MSFVSDKRIRFFFFNNSQEIIVFLGRIIRCKIYRDRASRPLTVRLHTPTFRDTLYTSGAYADRPLHTFLRISIVDCGNGCERAGPLLAPLPPLRVPRDAHARTRVCNCRRELMRAFLRVYRDRRMRARDAHLSFAGIAENSRRRPVGHARLGRRPSLASGPWTKGALCSGILALVSPSSSSSSSPCCRRSFHVDASSLTSDGFRRRRPLGSP